MNAARKKQCIGAIALAMSATVFADNKSGDNMAIELPLSGPAYQLADDAYKAYNEGDYAGAIVKAREALRLRPDVVRLKALLDNASAAREMQRRSAITVTGSKAIATKNSNPKTVTRLPASNQAFVAADRAYKAFDKSDFANAIVDAKSAVLIAPGNRAYRLLLVNSLAAAERFDEAEKAIDTAIATVGDADGALAARRAAMRVRLAAIPASETYRALERKDLPAAETEARKAVALAPDLMAYRFLLLNVLAQNRRWDEAEAAALDALKIDDRDSSLYAMLGYVRHRAGRGADAQSDFDRALKQSGLSGTALRNIAVIAADVAMADRKPHRALDLLAPYAGKEIESIDTRLREARAASARIDSGRVLAARQPMMVPDLDCRTTPDGQVCSTVPGAPPRDAGFDMATEAYAAVTARNFAFAVEKARAAVNAAPDNRTYKLLLINALQANRNEKEAEALASQLLATDGNEASLLIQRGMLRKELGLVDAAKQDFAAAEQMRALGSNQEITLLTELGRRREASELFAQALSNGSLDTMRDVEIAYLAVSVGDDRRASEAFQRADANGDLTENAYRDAGFAAMRAGRNESAIAYFKRSIDAAASNKLAISDQERFALRRTVSELTRTWGIFAGIGYRGATTLAGTTPRSPDISNDTLQAGAELYWRPFDSNNGRHLDLFVRGYETLYSRAGERTFGATLQGAAGVRVKPVGDTNLFFSLSRLFAVGSQTNSDWLAQASYFYGEGVDLRVDTPGWWTRQLTVELGHYFTRPQTYGTVNAQIGRSFLLSNGQSNLVLFPHLVAAVDYNSTYANQTATGVGPGVTLRYWFNEDFYSAPRSYADVTLQYRARVSGDDRAKGVFLTTAVSY